MILAFETSTDVCSVAFQDRNGKVFEKKVQGRSVHSEHLFLFTEALMQEHRFTINDIEIVLVSNGPGSYTGLRIAASAIKGLFFNCSVKIYGVSTLAGFASAIEEGSIHAIIDARRTHVYHQKFEKSTELNSSTDISIKEIEDLESELERNDYLIGTGISRFNETSLQKVHVHGSEDISAANLISLFTVQPNSEFFIRTSIEDLDPNYITSNQVNNSAS